VTTDINYVVNNKEDASADGYLFLIADDICSEKEIQSEVGLYSPTTLQNHHFAWGNLHPRYWTWRRSSQNGNMNAGAVNFDSCIKFLEHSNIKFGFQSDLDPYRKITTNFGDGQIIDAERDLDTDFLTIKIGYDPYA